MSRRLVRVLLLAAFALIAFTGCEVSGTVDVRSAEVVDLDLTVKGDDYYLPCASSGWGAGSLPLGFNEFVDERGETTCRVFGTIHPELVRDYLQISQPGEYLEAASNPLAMAPGKDVPIGSVWSSPRTKLDVTVTFPGRVLNSTGEGNGNAVHFGDPKQYVRPYGLRATALNHPGPEWSTVGPGVGVAAGIGLAAVAMYLWRQRLRTTEPSTPVQVATSAESFNQPESAGHPESSGQAEPSNQQDEPGTSDEAVQVVDPTREVAPAHTLSHSAEPRATGRQPDDPSRWAPPSL